MGVANSADLGDDSEDFEDNEDFAFLDESSQPSVKRNKLAWRSVEDYLDDRRLKEDLSDIFDEDGF